MSQRKAVTKAIATRYKRANKATKGVILDELCATTDWHRNHARKALAQALKPAVVKPRTPRPPKYGPEVIAALRFCWATGPDENRSVPNKARKWVIAALEEISKILPFPLLGVDSDNGAEFINHHLPNWCEKRQITFTRSRPGNSNDGAHAEQKNWAIVRTVVGYHRYDTVAELKLINKIRVLQSKLTNYFYPQQKLLSKVRHGAKVTKKHDTATTPHLRAECHDAVTAEDKEALADAHANLNRLRFNGRLRL